MAIDLTNGMFALNIGYPAPTVYDPDGVIGSGTLADPYMMTVSGTPWPAAKLTDKTFALIATAFGATKSNVRIMADFFNTGVPYPYLMSFNKLSTTAQWTLALDTFSLGSPWGTLGAPEVEKLKAIMGYQTCATFAEAGTMYNMANDVTTRSDNDADGASNYRYGLGLRFGGIPSMNTLNLPLDFTDLYNGATNHGWTLSSSSGLGGSYIPGVAFICDSSGNQTQAQVNINLYWDDLSGASQSYKMLEIIKNAGSAPTNTWAALKQCATPGGALVTGAQGYFYSSNSKYYGTANNTLVTSLATLKTAFPGKGKLRLEIPKQASRNAQVYGCFTNIGLQITRTS